MCDSPIFKCMLRMLIKIWQKCKIEITWYGQAIFFSPCIWWSWLCFLNWTAADLTVTIYTKVDDVLGLPRSEIIEINQTCKSTGTIN